MLQEKKTNIIVGQGFGGVNSSRPVTSDLSVIYEILKAHSAKETRYDAAVHLLKLAEQDLEIDAQEIKEIYDSEKDIKVATELKRLLNKLQMLQKQGSDPSAKYDRKLTVAEEETLQIEIGRLRELYDRVHDKKGSFDEKFKIVGKIKDGGMGRIYKATRLGDDKPVAIKFLMLEELAVNNSRERIIARFKREGELLTKRLKHPNIVEAFEYGETKGEYFLVMEYLGGGTVEDLIAGGRLDFEVFKAIALQLCDAVEYIHKNGVIHRDIKPGNMLLASNGREVEKIKLCDFGLSKDKKDTKLSRISFQAGTDDYSSPQQLRDARTADEKDDIYSMGKTFYQILTGRVLESDKEYEEVSAGNSSVPKGMDTILRKCIEYRKEGRFQRVSDLSKALMNIY